MASRPTVVQQSELMQALVLDRNTTEDLGRVEMLWMHPQSHRVLGCICKTGFLKARKLAFNLPQIK
jgi:uncharacterized protein YrrD